MQSLNMLKSKKLCGKTINYYLNIRQQTFTIDYK